MKTIKTFLIPDGPTKQNVDTLSEVLTTLSLQGNEIPCLLVNREGPYDVYYLQDHYQDPEPGNPIWEIKLVIYTKAEYEKIDLLQNEMDQLMFSCEMNDLMTGGEQFGQNDSSIERLNDISTELREHYQIH